MGRILVGVDGSKESRRALEYAEQIARATSSRLTIASAVEPSLHVAGLETKAESESDLRAARTYARAMVKRVASSVRPGIEVETLVSDGNPAGVLAELANAPEVDFVVVGHRTRNPLARVLLGSVAGRLLQISPKPVLVVR
jgi:nucleotide-binding universal stress UspA family protein